MKPLDNRTKWSYCVGATGRDMAYALVSMYLLLYVQYTMNLTAAQFSVITACMVACMVWDAVNDPMMGIIIENSHLKWGKYKPWILMGCILNALVIVGLFTLRPTGWGFVAFYGVGYLLWGMTYTMNDIAYWGMLPSLSSDAGVRNTLVTLMSVFICVGQFSVAAIVPTIIAGNAVQTYRVVALVVALCFIAFQMLTVLGVRECERTDAVEKVTLRGMFRIFFRNDQLIASGVSYLLFNVGQNLLFLFGVNFFYVEFGYAGGGDLVFWFTLMYGLGTLISQALFAFLSARFTRAQLLRAAVVCILAGYLAFLGFGYVLPRSVVLLNAIAFVIFFFQGLYNLVLLVMVNNTIEYDEYRFHERHDSIISAVRSFAVKLASGVDQGLSTLVLIVSGVYAVSRQISALEMLSNEGSLDKSSVLAQADACLAGLDPSQAFKLRFGMVLIPVVTILASYLLLRRKYTLTEQEYERIVKCLNAPKESSEQ